MVLTKELVINKYKEKYLDDYENLSEFRLIMLLVENYENIVVSKDLPEYLFFDNFDLMLEIFGEWQYKSMTDKDIAKLADTINKAVDLKVNTYHIENIFFAITTYAPKIVINKVLNNLSQNAKLLWEKSN